MYSVSCERSLFVTAALAGAAAFDASGVLAAPPAPVYNWTGFYLGANFGAGDAWNHLHEPGFKGDADNAFGVFGGSIGADYQILPSWVIGVEAKLDFMPGNNTSLIEDSQTTAQTNWGAGVEGKIGYLFTPQLWAYATVGGGWRNTQIGFGDEVDKSTVTGLTWGAGVEYAVTNKWHLFVEGQYFSAWGHPEFFDIPDCFDSFAGWFGVKYHVK